MRFFLQQGYGMMGMNKEFSKKFDDIGFILAPRSMQRGAKVSRLANHAKVLKKQGAKVLFDPEFYDPKTNMDKILKYPYFSDFDFKTKEFIDIYAKDFVKKVIDYQIKEIGVDEVIIPNRYVNSIDVDWKNMQDNFIASIEEYDTDLRTYLTLALGPDVVKNSREFDDLISQCVNYPVDGFYFVLKSPKNQYLVDDEEYLYAILDAFISLKIAGKSIILGYANQQSLIFAASGIETIASGNFRNVRSFNPEKYFESDEESHFQKAVWYYDSNSLSEFRAQQLDVPFRRGLRQYFGAESEYCKDLLNDKKPSSVPWGEGKAFRHFLVSFRSQWLDIKKINMSERITYIIKLLNKIENHINDLEERGFRIGRRGFNQNIIDACLGALTAIKTDRKYDISCL